MLASMLTLPNHYRLNRHHWLIMVYGADCKTLCSFSPLWPFWKFRCLWLCFRCVDHIKLVDSVKCPSLYFWTILIACVHISQCEGTSKYQLFSTVICDLEHTLSVGFDQDVSDWQPQIRIKSENRLKSRDCARFTKQKSTFTPCTKPLRPGCHNFSFLLQSRGCSTCGNSLYSQAVCQEQPPRGPLVTTGSFSSSSSVMKSFSNTVEEKSLRQIWASLLHFWVVEEECVCCNAGLQPWVVGWRRRFWSPLVSRREQSAGVEDFFYFFFCC